MAMNTTAYNAGDQKPRWVQKKGWQTVSTAIKRKHRRKQIVSRGQQEESFSSASVDDTRTFSRLIKTVFETMVMKTFFYQKVIFYFKASALQCCSDHTKWALVLPMVFYGKLQLCSRNCAIEKASNKKYSDYLKRLYSKRKLVIETVR